MQMQMQMPESRWVGLGEMPDRWDAPGDRYYSVPAQVPSCPRMGDGMALVLRRSKPSGDASTHVFRNGISGQATGSRGRSNLEDG